MKAAEYLVVSQEELASGELEGYRMGATGVSLILVDLPPGSGIRLHRHA